MRFIFCIYLLLCTLTIYSQKREIEFAFNPTIFFKVENTRDIQVLFHYKYQPQKLPVMLCTGFDYIENHANWGKLRMSKLIIPAILNFSIGNYYRFYGGLGIYGSSNLSKEKNDKMKPSLFQMGVYFNLGGQFRIHKQLYFNTELTFIRDLSRTYIDITTPPPVLSTYGDYFMKYPGINFGCTYRLSKDKKK